jgi:mannose/fructose/N-acetylgalactosamine-specific phosphotransferase system component IIB
MNKTAEINVVVCPKQKVVKVFERTKKRGKAVLLKTYRFKEEIQKVQKTVRIEHYNWGEWCVSERGWTEDKIINVYDENIINSIKERALNYYNQNKKDDNRTTNN